MLIRRPVAEVFEAFVDPEIISMFWFTRSSGRLEEGAEVRWEWEMYGFTITATVKAFVQNERLLIEWPGQRSPSLFEVRFRPLEAGTFVEIKSFQFVGTGDEQVKEAIDSGEGFSFVLAGAKAFLEHGVRLNLVLDRFPKGA